MATSSPGGATLALSASPKTSGQRSWTRRAGSLRVGGLHAAAARPDSRHMRGIFRVLEERGEEFAPGDVVMHNSPYHGASHGPDVGFCVPVFHDGDLIGFFLHHGAPSGHGALHPGSTGIVDAYAECLQFKAVKVYEVGRKTRRSGRFAGQHPGAEMVVGDMEARSLPVASGRSASSSWSNSTG